MGKLTPPTNCIISTAECNEGDIRFIPIVTPLTGGGKLHCEGAELWEKLNCGTVGKAELWEG